MSDTPTIATPTEAPREWPQPGDRVLSRYVVSQLLGAGGMGMVFRAFDPQLKRDVALKVLRASVSSAPETRTRFEQEARILARIDHPGTVQVYDVGEERGQLVLAMEYVAGRTLAEVLLEESALEPARVVRIGVGVCELLARAHAVGVVHRDIKPANIMLTLRDGVEAARLLDFGVARLNEEAPPEGRLTQEGYTIGTPDFMSPEQCRGQEIDGRSDLYSLGCVLYELLTATPVFGVSSGADLMSYHLHRAPTAPSRRRPELALPEALDRVVLALLQKNAVDRPANALVAKQLLEESLTPAKRGIPTRPSRTVEARSGAGSTTARSPWPIALAGDGPAEVFDALETALSASGFLPLRLDGPDEGPFSAIVYVAPRAGDATGPLTTFVTAGHTPVLCCGPEDDLDLVTRAIAARAYDYVGLPLDPSDLVRKVERAARARLA